MEPPLNVLIIEDNQADFLLVKRHLQQQERGIQCHRADSGETLGRALDAGAWDIVLSDYSVPGLTFQDTFARIQARMPDLPVILVSGSIGEEQAVELLKLGVKDFVLKNNLARLVPAMDRVLKEAADAIQRRSLEEQLRQSQKMEAVGQLAGGVAHDFNNIMQVIVGNAQLQFMHNQEHGVETRYLDEIFKAVERGSSLTRSLLVFSRKQPLDISGFDLNSLISESHNLASRLVTEEIRLSLDLHDGPLPVTGDVGLVQQILFNLVTNARDAIARTGSIAVVTGMVTIDTHLPRLSEIMAPQGTYALLSVSDTGCGISDDIRGKIFEPFFTTKEPGKGTGLGLAMIHSTVSQMGGHIAIDSAVGRGTVISIYLPLREPSAEGTPSGGHGHRHDLRGRGELILITEDEEGVRDSIAEILTFFDYRIVKAASADEAITLTREHARDIRLALLDIGLPDMNGTDALKELHAITPGLPSLFLSGHNDDTLEARGISGHHLRKPVHPVQLLRHVRRLLDVNGATRPEPH
ncbi:MAG TPA: response regulator [Desulfuromonadaceae bacterium]